MRSVSLVVAMSAIFMGTACVEVTEPSFVNAVTVLSPRAVITQGESMQLVAIPVNDRGGIISGRHVAWMSTNTNVATVSSSGAVTGVAPGSTEIKATSEGQTGQLAITVVSGSASSLPSFTGK